MSISLWTRIALSSCLVVFFYLFYGVACVYAMPSEEAVIADTNKVLLPDRVDQPMWIQPTFWEPPNPAYKIEITADGLYALRYLDLKQTGLPIDSLDPRSLRLFYMGREIAIRVAGEEDGRFDPQDSLLFYGRSVDSLYFEGLLPAHRYTGVNIYWLSYGGVAGKRMAVTQENSVQRDLSGAPIKNQSTLENFVGAPDRSFLDDYTLSTAFLQIDHQEQQKRYVTEYPRYLQPPLFHLTDDHWFWYKLQIIGNAGTKTQNFPFSLQDPLTATDLISATQAYTGSVIVHVVGGYDAKHGLRLRLNNQLIYENSTAWDAYEGFQATALFSQSLLTAGANSLQVEMFNVDSNFSENYIDWVELRYYKKYAAINDELSFRGESPGNAAIPGGIRADVPPGMAAFPGWSYQVTGFNSNTITNPIEIYDVTDLEQVQRIGNVTVTGSGPLTATFVSAGSDRRFIALTAAKRLTPASIYTATRQLSAYTPSQQLITQGGSSMGSLLDARNGADWIVITHRDFWSSVLPLAQHRAKGMRVAMVDVQAIYDQFNGGMISSQAIRDFLAYASANWQAPAPRFVLLAGGGVSDMRRYLSNSKMTYVPTFIYPADPILGETAADNRFVTFFNDDAVPDLHIGRFPAYSTAEITTMVSKTIRYETTPVYNAWNQNILMISDDLEGGGGNFYEFSNSIAEGSSNPLEPLATKFIPILYRPIKVYLGETCDLNNPSLATECRAKIADVLNRQGALITSYVGHAQTTNWGSEKLMDVSLASSLTNTNKLSIFLPMACFEGFFHESSQFSRSLAESYLLNPQGGAVASWSPTGFGVATGHDWLEQGFFIGLFQKHLTRMGEVTTFGKQYLYDNSPLHKYTDLLDTYHLLGDPALQIQTYLAPTSANEVTLSAQAQTTGGIALQWQTKNEVEALGFQLLRSEQADGPFAAITLDPIPAQHAGSSQGATYTYLDTSAQPGMDYWYQVAILLLEGGEQHSQPVSITRINSLFLPLVTK